jgi:D-arabinose 5-phosphate isomerase GutQ
VATRKPDTALDRAADIVLLLRTKTSHCKAGNYQIVREERVTVRETLNPLDAIDREAVFDE